MGQAGVIIAAAGSGTRMGQDVNKVLLPLCGIPILIRSIKAFAQFPWVRELVVVVRREDYNQIAELMQQWQIAGAKVVIGAAGGRIQSLLESTPYQRGSIGFLFTMPPDL